MPNEIKKIYVHLSASEEERVKYYLVRTTLLWNLVLVHIGDLAEVYFNEPDSPKSDQDFDDVIDMIYQVVIKNDTWLIPGFKLDAKYKQMVASINELPDEVIQFRLIDMKRCFHSTKERRLASEGEAFKAPAKKHNRSKKSCRFGRDHFTLSPAGELDIKTQWNELSVTDPQFQGIDLDKLRMITITTASLSSKQRHHLGLRLGTKYYCFTFFFG